MPGVALRQLELPPRRARRQRAFRPSRRASLRHDVGPAKPGSPQLEAYHRDEVSACVRCPLSEGRTQVVVGSGDLDADLMFVGEAPGYHEDRQGVPFVGQAGKLLTSPDRGHRAVARRRLHRQRPQVPAAGQPRPAARARSARASRTCSGRSRSSARRWSARSATSPPSCSRAGPTGSPASTATSCRSSSPASRCCCTRSSTRRRPSTRARCSRPSRPTSPASRACWPPAPGARRAAGPRAAAVVRRRAARRAGTGRAVRRAARPLLSERPLTWESDGPDDTAALGAALAALLRPGRPRAAARRARGREDHPGAGGRAGARRDGAGDEPDLHGRAAVRGRRPGGPRQRVPARGARRRGRRAAARRPSRTRSASWSGRTPSWPRCSRSPAWSWNCSTWAAIGGWYCWTRESPIPAPSWSASLPTFALDTATASPSLALVRDDAADRGAVARRRSPAPGAACSRRPTACSSAAGATVRDVDGDRRRGRARRLHRAAHRHRDRPRARAGAGRARDRRLVARGARAGDRRGGPRGRRRGAGARRPSPRAVRGGLRAEAGRRPRGAARAGGARARPTCAPELAGLGDEVWLGGEGLEAGRRGAARAPPLRRLPAGAAAAHRIRRPPCSPGASPPARACRRGRSTPACPTPRSTASRPPARPPRSRREDGTGQARRRPAGDQGPRDAARATSPRWSRSRTRPRRRPGRGRCSCPSSAAPARSTSSPTAAGDVLAYVMVSRYADVWHILNLCVRESQRGQGLGARMLDELFVRAGKQGPPGLHPRGPRVQRRGHPALPPQGLPRARRAPRLLLGQRRGRDHHVARRRAGRGRRVTGGPDPRDRDLLRRDGRRRRRGAGEIVSSVVASQADLHAPYGGVVPEVAARHHLGTVNAVVDRALEEAGARARRGRGGRGHPAARADRRAAGGRVDREGIGLRGGKTTGDGGPPPRAHRRGLAGAGRPGPALREPDRLGRAHAARPRDRLRPAAAPRPDDRRRGRRGDRQGRPAARPGVPGRPGARAPGAARATAPRIASPWGWRVGARATSRSPG